jgi:DNA-binding transcriptional LysR family regulator
MDIVQLKSFVKVAEERSFTRAARQLFVATSALSRRIRDLETELGATLLYREYRSNELTPVGEALLPLARDLVHRFDEFTRAARATGCAQGRPIVIGFPPLLHPLPLQALLSITGNYFPEHRIKLRPAANAELTKCLAEHEIDLALIHEYVPTPKVDAVLVLAEELGVVIPKGFLGGQRARATLEELADLMYVTSENISAPLLYKHIDMVLDQARIIHRFELPRHEPLTVLNLIVSRKAFALCPQSDTNPVTRFYAGQAVDILPLSKVNILISTYIGWNSEDLAADSVISSIARDVQSAYPAPVTL